MGIPLTRQLAAIVYAILTGVLIGVIYDAVRILRVMLGVSTYTKTGKALYEKKLPLIGAVHRKTFFEGNRLLRLCLLFLGDVGFASLAACAFTVCLYHAASGTFRWFYLFALLVGFTVYYFTAGKVMMLCSEMLSFVIAIALRYTVYFVCVPFRLLGRSVCCIYQWMLRQLVRPVLTRIQYIRRIRYTRRVSAALPIAVRFENQHEF